ncbi:histidine kinase [Microbacterium sp. M3]|uniref:histidine kinase n=1 Tax=Microbacterium arthrosphaerae TaxID=792652 RepID=A0ABU4H4P2_9MICO|nr:MULTISPECIES: histidine kinase [Microbacterium]MDW4574307.1 histidine kinase [Microbacterium arthrosphaerae]MDW7608162.1 histidine kinase [Microbacterium sp. M3]
MTVAARPALRRFARVGRVGRSVLILVLGALCDMYCVINVPGAATLTGGDEPQAQITRLGVMIALVAIACWTTVFVRVRIPIAVVAAGGLLMLVGVSYVLALVGVYHALIRWPRRTPLIGSLTVAAVALFVLREAFTAWGGALAWTFDNAPYTDASPVWNVAAAVIAVLSLGLVAGLVAYRRARIEASVSRVRADFEHERADALDMQVARQAERERIARDLHDGLGHRLSSVALAAGAFEAQAGTTVDPALTEWARTVRRQAHAALEDVRDVVGGLRSDAAGDEVLPPASLRGLAAMISELRAGGHRVDAYVVVEGIERLSPAVDAAAFRIVQESLTNAIKHAPGATVSLTVDAAPDRGVRVRVENALVPVATGVPSGGRGLLGIRERAASVDGTAWIGPHAGRFVTDVSLPWRDRP